MTKAEKKQAKQDKKDRKKASAAPATVSHTTAEPDRPAHDNDEDRALAGLSPAAKLARQHTLRSKAEQAKRDRNTPPTGEPTWDNNTQTRNGAPVLPSIESLTSGLSTLSTGNGPEVVRVQPRSRQTVVHAVNVADHEYDSEDDSSDGETIEDATIGVAKARFSQDTQRSNGETDDDFKARWGSTWIDRNAVPKKGILKRGFSWVFMRYLADGQNTIPIPKVNNVNDQLRMLEHISLLAHYPISHLQTQLISTDLPIPSLNTLEGPNSPNT